MFLHDRKLNRRPALLLAAFVLFFAVSAIAEAGHTHDLRSPDSYKNCSICAGAHLASTGLVARAQIALPALARAAVVETLISGYCAGPEKGALYVRPPPAA